MATGAFLPPVVTRLSMNIDDFVAGVAKAKAALNTLPDSLKLDVKTDGLDAAIAKMEAYKNLTAETTFAQAALKSAIQDTNTALLYQSSALDLVNKGLTGMNMRLNRAIANEVTLAAAVDLANNSLRDQGNIAPGLLAGAAGRGGGGGWGWLAGLGASVPLWGGAFGATPLIGALPAWHLALSGALDLTIGLVSATIALGAAMAAMTPAAQDIYNRFNAIREVAVALNGGTGIPPLSGWFEKLQHAVAGNTIGAYGGIMGLLAGTQNNQTASTVQQISAGLDTWIAKLDIYRATQGNANGILQHGLGYASQFSVIVDNLGKSFVNLLHAEPGTVHYMLNFTEAVSGGIQWLTHFNGLMKDALGFHAFLAYGGLAYSLLGRLLGRIPLVGTAIQGAMANPFVAGATMVVAGLVLWWTRATSSVQNYIRTQNAALAAMSAGQAVNAIPGMIQGLNGQIPGLHGMVLSDWNDPSKAVRAWGYQFQQAWKDFASIGTSGNPLRSILHTVTDLFDPNAGQGLAQQDYLNKLHGQIRTLSGDWMNLFGVAAPLVKQGYSMADAFGLESLAGVKANDSFQVMQQKVQNLIRGYGDLGNNAGMLTNSINAVSFATEQQNSHITAVTQGWSAFIGMLTGGASGFATFEQQMIGINQLMGNAAATVSIANGKVSVSTKGQPGSVGGITTAQLQNLQAFTSGIGNASSLLNQLYTLDSAAALGARGVNMLQQAGKDMVIQFLPMAKGSQLLTTMLYGLAQQGGYKGADSLQKLAQWAGNAKNPVRDLLGITTQFTVAAGNLGTDVKNLANAIDPTMTNAMTNAIVQASGGTAALENWATAVLRGYNNSKQLSAGAQGLWQEIHLVYQNTGQARDMFDAYNIRLGITRSLSDKLFSDMQASGGRMTAAVLGDLQAIQEYLNSMHGKTIFINAVSNVPGITQSPSYGPYASGYRVSGSTLAHAAMSFTGSSIGGGVHAAPVLEVHSHVYLDGKEIYRTTQKEAVNTQRRTGSNGLSKRTR